MSNSARYSILCVTLVPVIVSGSRARVGQTVRMPPSLYRQWRGLDYMARVVQHGTCFGVPFLYFPDSGVPPRGTPAEVAATLAAQPYYYGGSTCWDKLEPVGDKEERAKIAREMLREGYKTLPDHRKPDDCCGKKAARLKKETEKLMVDRSVSRPPTPYGPLDLTARIRAVEEQLTREQQKPRRCPSRMSRLKAWLRRLKLQEERETTVE